MRDQEEFIWANTDYPYLCLVDIKRTETFKQAIQKVVKPGSIVIDIGSGTGIFALFAAEAGAAKVYAVEVEHLLATCLRQTVAASKYEDVIEVVEGNALEVDLPKNVDVVIAELIETGLMDEMQVPVMNALHEQGIIGSNTKVIPQANKTNLELIHIDDTFYGHVIKAPKHMWPFYNLDSKEWSQPTVTPLSDKLTVVDLNLEGGVNNQDVDKTLTFKILKTDKPINAIRISGILTLTNGVELGAAHSVNGDKVLSLPEDFHPTADQVNLHVSYKMGGGLGSFQAKIV